MARNKRARNVSIAPWLSANAGNKEGRFIQVGNSLLLSEAFKALSGCAFRLYFCMCMECGGKSIFTFSAGTAKKYGISEASFRRAKKELQEWGFIKLLLDEERAQFKACKFQFASGWKLKPAAHFDGGKD